MSDDRTVIDDVYRDALRKLMDDALDAEELFSLEELEDYAKERYGQD